MCSSIALDSVRQVKLGGLEKDRNIELMNIDSNIRERVEQAVSNGYELGALPTHHPQAEERIDGAVDLRCDRAQL